MSFLDWLSGRPNLELPPAPNKEFGPERDDWQRDLPIGALESVDADKDGIPDAIAGICVWIDYVDASGAKSNRRVLVEKLYSEGNFLYLAGFCLLRQEQRTFRADRIQDLRLPPSWREVSDPVSFLMAYLPAEKQIKKTNWQSFVEDSERYARLYETRKAANHGLRVLAFVARSDGSIADTERSVVYSYVRNAAALVGEELSDDDCKEIASDIETLFPTKRQVANSLNVIRLYHEQSEIFMSSLKFMVRADGEINDREQSAVQMLVEILHRETKRAEKART